MLPAVIVSRMSLWIFIVSLLVCTSVTSCASTSMRMTDLRGSGRSVDGRRPKGGRYYRQNTNDTNQSRQHNDEVLSEQTTPYLGCGWRLHYSRLLFPM